MAALVPLAARVLTPFLHLHQFFTGGLPEPFPVAKAECVGTWGSDQLATPALQLSAAENRPILRARASLAYLQGYARAHPALPTTALQVPIARRARTAATLGCAHLLFPPGAPARGPLARTRMQDPAVQACSVSMRASPMESRGRAACVRRSTACRQVGALSQSR